MWQRVLRKAIPWTAALPILWAASSATAEEAANAPAGEAVAGATETPVERAWYRPWFNGWGEYLPRAGLGYEVRDGIGYSDGYGRVEGLIPLAEDPGQLLIFSDLRMLLDNDGHPGGNLGLGYRYYVAEFDRTFGAVFYYDLRETDIKTFQQLTVSFDTLGSWLDFRTNVYVQSIFSDRGYEPTRFIGNYLLLSGEDRALSGLDMEAMVPLPMWRSFDPRLGVGGYHFQGVNVDDIWGWKVRLETRMDEKVTVDLAVSDDEQFGTTATLGVAMWLPNLWAQRPGAGSGRRPPAQRLGEPVHRLENIAVVSRPSEVARDPATGNPWTFLHVAPESAQSDGSFESPFGSLGAAISDPRYQSGGVDVVYVRSDPAAPLVHVGAVTFVAGAQLRSNGPVQTIETQQGRVRLPLSGADPDFLGLPQIIGRTSLANDTYLSGFDIQGTVVGTDVSNLTIAENRLTSTGVMVIGGPQSMPGYTSFYIWPEAIGVTRATGTVTIRDNVICGQGFAGAHGVTLTDTQGATVTIAGNRVQDCTAGIVVSGGTATGNITGNTIASEPPFPDPWQHMPTQRSESPAPGMVPYPPSALLSVAGISLVSGSAFRGNVTDNTITGMARGIEVVSPAESNQQPTSFAGTISYNQILNSGSSGIDLNMPDFTGEIRNNTISGSRYEGIAGSFYRGRFDGQIANNVIRDNGWEGIRFSFSSSDVDHRVAVLNNEFSGNARELSDYSLLARDVEIYQRTDSSSVGNLYVALDGNLSRDVVTTGSARYNYRLTRIPSTYGPSHGSHYYVHLGENVGTIGHGSPDTRLDNWNEWPAWPEE